MSKEVLNLIADIISPPPDEINAIFDDDYNICYVHEQVKRSFEYERTVVVVNYKMELETIQENIDKFQNKESSGSLIELIALLNRKKEIESKIEEINSRAKEMEYLQAIHDILEAYKKIREPIKVIKYDSEEEYKPNYQRINIINKYINLASKYVKIKINLRTKYRFDKDICVGCGFELIDDGSGYCDKCHTEYTIRAGNKSGKDKTRFGGSSKSDEDDTLNNFIKTMDRYQGIQNDKPPDIIYQRLDKYFSEMGVKDKEYFRSLPYDKRGLKEGTNHKMLLNALSEIQGGSAYYEDVNLIGHIYWGWKLPDISKYREKIIDHYRKTQKVWYQIPQSEKNRSSSLGTQYRLWRHLQLVGHDCSFGDFKIPQNQKSIQNQDEIWKKMVKLANDPEIKYIE